MKQKTSITIFAIIFLIGIVTATGTITNINPLELDIPSFIAGDTTETTFSFDYENDGINNPDASLVLRVIIDSLNSGFPVWKEDFQLGGFIKKYSFSNLFLGEIFPLECFEDTAEFRVQQGLLYTEKDIPVGTFYCYDPNDYIDMLELGKRDEVTLSISSDPALYPGSYDIEVELMEMEPDNSPPEIELILDNFYFDGTQTIPIKLDVTDMYNIQTVKYKITNPDVSSYYNSGWLDTQLNENSGFYEAEFDPNDYELIESGSYWIYAWACDVLGNCREM